MIVWGNEPEPLPARWEQPYVVALAIVALVVVKAASEWWAGY